MDRRSLSFPMKFKDKADFLNTSEKEWKQFLSLLEGLTEPELLENGVWGENWNIRDMMAHIHEWHNMVLKWHSEGQKGSVEMPAPGYKWSETPRLNHDIYEEYRSLPHAEAATETDATRVSSTSGRLMVGTVVVGSPPRGAPPGRERSTYLSSAPASMGSATPVT